jgi:hypothetical protein
MMHLFLVERFQRLGALYLASDIDTPDNYFGIYDSPTLGKSTEKQFIGWESILQELDEASFKTFLRKAAGRVSARPNKDRGWSQLIESINEARGYQYAKSLGYFRCRLLDERAGRLPDIEAFGDAGKCLVEVKTIQESDLEISMHGQVQVGELGLPKRLTRAIRNAYRNAAEQIAAHPWANEARKVCHLTITVDLRTALVRENEQLLEEYVRQLQEQGRVEIFLHSQYWPAGREA